MVVRSQWLELIIFKLHVYFQQFIRINPTVFFSNTVYRRHDQFRRGRMGHRLDRGVSESRRQQRPSDRLCLHLLSVCRQQQNNYYYYSGLREGAQKY